MKKIYIVTHGIAEENKPDPPLSEKGKEQMERLKEFLPPKFNLTVSGAGIRHQKSFGILLGKKPNRKSASMGVPEVLSANRKEMIFPDGKKVSIKEYAKTRLPLLLKEASSFLKEEIFKKEGEEALIVGGRIAVIALGVRNAKSGVLYIFDENQKLIETHEGN